MKAWLSGCCRLSVLVITLLIAINAADEAGRIAGQASAQEQQASPRLVPLGHFKVTNPADLDNARALSIYERVADDIARGYAMSHVRHAETYRRWHRDNATPYRSATHGERFINNYANAQASDYSNLDQVAQLPVGAVLAKDSFAVTSDSDVFSGPLFLMEKMPAGFWPDARDWRYTMIMPDGSLFGMTDAEGSDGVGFCVTCHRTAGDDKDHLFQILRRIAP